MSKDSHPDGHQQVSQDDGSSGVAGLVRGLSRSIRVAQRSIVGQLPRRKLAMKRVGKISDRASLGIDIFTNISETTDGGGSEAKTRQSLRKFRLQQVYGFSKNLIRNTVLGTVVFEVYEQVSSGSLNHTIPFDWIDKKEMSTHILAGAMGGVAHSVLGVVFDAAETRSFPSLQNFGRVTFHHSLAHSCLFGSYFVTRQKLLEFVDVRDLDDLHFGGGDIHYDLHMIATATAGGIAGVFQHIVSHYSGMWLQVETTHKSLRQLDMMHGVRVPGHFQSLIRSFLPAPNFRATVTAFPVMSIAFLAFEYARDLGDE